jgi:hypothetical protein
VFWEAKLVTNSEARSKPVPKVFEQLERYQTPDCTASAAAAASLTLPVPRFMPSAFEPKVFEINL